MEGFSFDRINSLEKSRTDWKIKARVTRMWPTVSPDSGATKGFNLILLDDDNSHIHAFTFPDVWRAIGKNVVEGSIYIIDTFIVKEAAGVLKPVSSDVAIRFTNATSFQPCPDDVMIPAHKFEFLDLGDLFAEANRLAPNQNPEFAIDVIGVVENFEKVSRQPTKFGEKDISRFRICDASNHHRVGVWGDLAKVVSEEFSKFDPNDRVIVILTSAKMSTYKNSVQLGTLPSSKVYFNLAHESVDEMRQRLEEEGYRPYYSTIDTSTALTVVSPFNNISLKDLLEKPAQYVNAKVFCTFTISKLEKGTGWFIFSCNKCKLEVFESGKKFKCETCPRTMPVAEKRFQIKATAHDPTYSCSIFLMDRVVKRFSSCTASQLYISQSKDDQHTKVFPPVLNSMVGQDITATIEVTMGKDNHDQLVLRALDFYDSVMHLNTHTESSSNQLIPSYDLSEAFDEAESSKTPGSAKSVNKKIKMEK